MDHGVLIGDIVTHWHRLNPDRRRTVVFATNVAHSIHIKEEFVRSDVKAEHIDGKTPKDERDAILARLANGDLELVSNCMVLTEGWDMPSVQVCILARPTKSLGLFRQMVGKVLRPYPGKQHALIIDHAGATLLHGRVEDPIHWWLSPDLKAHNETHAARGAMASTQLLACTQCQAIRTAGQACPECGFLPKRQGEHQHFHDADLAELGRNGHRQGNVITMEMKLDWQRQLTAIAHERNRQPGWIAHSYKAKFGVWPVNRSVAPMEPTQEVRSWVRSRDIAWAKSQGRAA